MTGTALPRLVVLRALGLGDLLVTVPALRALAEAFPGHHRVLVAPAWLRPVVALLEDVVHEVVDADFRLGVGHVPARGEVAVNLHGAGPQSSRALLATGARRVLAFAHPGVPRIAGPAWHLEEHELERWCRLLEAFAIPVDRARWRLPAGGLPRRPSWRGATVLHPGAASAARRWPTSRWAAVARALQASGQPVVITGSVGERALAAEVAQRAGLGLSAVEAGRTSLTELAGGLSEARRVVAGDTGVAHLATALAVPSVLLFGPTPPSRWGPPRDQDGRHRVLWAGRCGDPHADRPDPGLLEISVDDVLDALAGRQAQPLTT